MKLLLVLSSELYRIFRKKIFMDVGKDGLRAAIHNTHTSFVYPFCIAKFFYSRYNVYLLVDRIGCAELCVVAKGYIHGYIEWRIFIYMAEELKCFK